MSSRTITVIAVLALAIAVGAAALTVAAGSGPTVKTYSVPTVINYQGILNSSTDGNPVSDGNYQMTFSLYGAQAATTPLWSETQTVIVADGLFNVLLGSVTPMSGSIFATGTGYLGIRVGTDTEMVPRQQLTSVPFAFQAQNAALLNGVDGSSFVRSDGDVSVGGNLAIAGRVGIGAPNPSVALELGENASLRLVGGTVFPVAPLEGQIFFRTDLKQMYVYANFKWQADRSSYTVVVAASDSDTKEKADYVADGTADDVEINAAINEAAAATSYGGTVFLLAGTYYPSGAILMKDFVHLMGEGNSSRIISARGAWPNAAIESADETDFVSGIEISDLMIDGVDVANRSAIRLSSFDEASIHNVYIFNMRGYGILLDNAGGGGGSNEFAIYDNFIDGTYYPIEIDNPEEAFFSVSNNIIWGGGYHDSPALQIQNTGRGGALVANNRIAGMQGPGISLVSANYVSVTGNTIGEIGRFADNTYDGIIVSGTSRGGQISGNVIIADTIWRPPGTIKINNEPRYGINISASTVNGYSVTNNKVYASGEGTIGTAAINDAGTDTLVAGNHGSVTTDGMYNIQVDSARSALSVEQSGSGYAALFFGGKVGIGTVSPTAELDVNGNTKVNGDLSVAGVVSSSGSTTALRRVTQLYFVGNDDSIILSDSSLAPFTVSLPTAAGNEGRLYTIKKTDSSTNAVTVRTQAEQTVDGAATYTLNSSWQYITIVSDGVNWLIVGKD